MLLNLLLDLCLQIAHFVCFCFFPVNQIIFPLVEIGHYFAEFLLDFLDGFRSRWLHINFRQLLLRHIIALTEYSISLVLVSA